MSTLVPHDYRSMKTVNLKHGMLHVETPNGIVNIRVGLKDFKGRDVDSIETIPDDYAGENKVLLRGLPDTRLIRCKGVKA